MSPAERIAATFEGRPTDRIPVHHIGFSSRAASLVLGREAYVGGGIQQWREAAALWRGADAHAEFLERTYRDSLDLARALEQDIVRVSWWRMPRRPVRVLDEWTMEFDLGGVREVRRFDPHTEMFPVIHREPPAEALTMEDLETRVAATERGIENWQPSEQAYADVLQAMRDLGPEHVVRCGGVGLGIPYSEPVWLEAVVVRPDLVERFLDVQVERAIRTVRLLAPLGVRYFWGGGDFASEHGPFYSPESFRKLMLPRLQRISQACHDVGAYHLFASDGNLWPVADDLFGRSGVDGFYEIDRRAGMDLARLRTTFPRLTLVGANIASYTLHMGTPDQVREETRSCLEAARRYGRIVVGCSNQVVPDTPPENLMAMVETLAAER